jgi:hypothetical protein
VIGRIMNVAAAAALLSLLSLARPVAAEAPAAGVGLQSPEQRSVRYSAYTLPQGMWGFELGALGVTGEELYASLGVRYGFGAGFELNVNAAHYAVGLFNVSARWGFLELERFALAANVDFTYGHGAWIWLVAPAVKDLLEEADIFLVPLGLTASVSIFDWLEADLGVSYRWGTVIGTLGDGDSFYADAQLGARQFLLRPAVRAFVSDATAIELGFDLPVYTWVPYEGELTVEARRKDYEKSGEGGATVPLSEAWKLEVGVRSRITQWLFCTLRLHYGRSNKVLYQTTVNPSLSLEVRL